MSDHIIRNRTQKRNRVAIVGALLLILVVVRLLARNLPWPYIAAFMALFAALLTVLSDERRSFGDGYGSPEEMNDPEKVRARRWARLLMDAALALVFFSALVPVLELPREDEVLRVSNEVDEVTFPDHTGKQRLNPDALKRSLAALGAKIDRIAARSPGASLLVQNCGMVQDCACPEGYQAVPDSGEWNLNDKTPGSSIRLCSGR